MDGVVYCCPGGCWGDAHACTRYLSPIGVPKFEDVVFENYLECVGESVGVVVVEGASSFMSYEVGDVSEGGTSTNVGVHGFCIGSEEECMWRHVYFREQLF